MASSIVFGNGNPVVSGKKVANKPDKTAELPINTKGKGFQISAKRSTMREKIAPKRATALQFPTAVDRIEVG